MSFYQDTLLEISCCHVKGVVVKKRDKKMGTPGEACVQPGQNNGAEKNPPGQGTQGSKPGRLVTLSELSFFTIFTVNVELCHCK